MTGSGSPNAAITSNKRNSQGNLNSHPKKFESDILNIIDNGFKPIKKPNIEDNLN